MTHASCFPYCACLYMQPAVFQFHPTHTAPLTFRLAPTPGNHTPDQLLATLTTRLQALAALPTPDILQVQGFEVTPEFIAAMSAARPRHMCVLGGDMHWPFDGPAQSAHVCWRLGQALSHTRMDVMVHESCGLRNLASLLLGRGVRAYEPTAGTVHVMTSSEGYETAVVKEARNKAGRLADLPRVQRCTEVPSLAARLRAAMSADQVAAVHAKQLARCTAVEAEGIAAAAALTAAASAATRAGRAEDAATLHAAATEATRMATQAAQMTQTLTEQADYVYPYDQVPAANSIAKVWEGARALVSTVRP